MHCVIGFKICSESFRWGESKMLVHGSICSMLGVLRMFRCYFHGYVWGLAGYMSTDMWFRNDPATWTSSTDLHHWSQILNQAKLVLLRNSQR
jgi:hypothetical protein